MKYKYIVIGLVFVCIIQLIGLNIQASQLKRHTCPPPTRLNTQKHWIAVHDPDWKIQNTLSSKMLDICSIECQPDYVAIMEAEERRLCE